MAPILDELRSKALAPFQEIVMADSGTRMITDEDSLSYFPSLPQIRNRRHYEADVDTKVQLCTKKYDSHPSLSPGIFTLFSPHG